jgi:uncharacterized protein YndB with AHSA1/START domain
MDELRLERDVLIEAPIERVWTLITQPEHLGTWFSDDGADVDLRPGGDMELRWKEYGAYKGRVERIDEPSAFFVRWQAFEAELEDGELTERNSTLVEFHLATEDDGTRVRVVESGFASLAGTPEERRKRLEGNIEGWEQELGELAAYAARVAA